MSGALLEGLSDNVLTMLIWNTQHAATLAMVIDDQLFNSVDYQKIARVSIDYINRFRRPPQEHIRDLLENDLRRREGANLIRIIDDSARLKDNLNPDYVMAELDKFVRMQTKSRALTRAHEALQAGNEEESDEILWQQTGIRTGMTAGVWLHDDNLDFLQSDSSNEFSSGIEALDQRGIRPERGTMILFIAPKKAGKCVMEGTLVLLPDGQMVPIEQVVDQKYPKVVTMTQDGNLVEAPVTEHWDNGVQMCYTIITTTGRTISTTAEHLYFTPNGWVPVESITPGADYIAVPKKISGLGSNTVALANARLLGYLVADGGFTASSGISFTKVDTAIRSDLEECVTVAGDKITWATNRPYGYIHNGNTTRWLAQLGLYGKLSKHKVLPNELFTWSDRCIAEFLRGLFSCDGYVSSRNSYIEITLSSFELVSQIKHLLLRFDVHSHLKYFTARYYNKTFPGYGRLCIRGATNIIQFLDTIGLVGQKAARADDMRNKLLQNKQVHRHHLCREWTDQVIFEKVVAIFPSGEHPTYDISVGDHHNFIANDIIVHNSWFCVNVGKAALQYGHSTLHMTLENSQRLTKRRYLQAFFSMTKSKAQTINVTNFTKDQYGNFVSFDQTKTIERISLTLDNRTEIVKRIHTLRSRPRLLIKEWPSGLLTIAQLNAFLDYLERTEDFVPDMLIVDMPDLMKINPAHKREETGVIYQQLRGVAGIRNMALCVPTQGNRHSEGAKLFGSKDVSEDWSKVGTADTVLTFNRTKQERDRKLARILVDAARDAEDQFIVLISQDYSVGQFCIDSVLLSKQANTALDRVVEGEPDEDELAPSEDEDS